MEEIILDYNQIFKEEYEKTGILKFIVRDIQRDYLCDNNFRTKKIILFSDLNSHIDFNDILGKKVQYCSTGVLKAISKEPVVGYALGTAWEIGLG